MAREALSSKTYPPAIESRQSFAAEKQKANKKKDLQGEHKNKTFERLSKEQKDKLLKKMAILLGLIEDSDD